ncbi:MAG TPA: hypothetical protein VLE20_09600, partial [Blastocatellia bacterium]|nr:hypothetical protein [Blastocatellia bacterium]
TSFFKLILVREDPCYLQAPTIIPTAIIIFPPRVHLAVRIHTTANTILLNEGRGFFSSRAK